MLEKERKSLEKNKDINDIAESARLAEAAVPLLIEAEQAMRAEGSAYSLARFAYQYHKSGLNSDRFFQELDKKIQSGGRITKETDPDEDAVMWALRDIAEWQILSGREEDTERTISRMYYPEMKAALYSQVGAKFVEQKKPAEKYLELAEQEIDHITDEASRRVEIHGLIGAYAQQGRKDEIQRLINKYVQDPVKQPEEWLMAGKWLLRYGFKADEIFLEIFKNEEVSLDPVYKTELIEGLIKTGHPNEAFVVLLEQEEGDTEELEEVWEVLKAAQQAGDQEAATQAWKLIASVSKLDPELVKRTGEELAEIGDEAGADAMISLLDKLKKQVPPEKEWEKGRIEHDKEKILLEKILQFVFKRRTEAEKRQLVQERFHQPIIGAVKDMLVSQVPTVDLKISGLKNLAEHLASRGNQPNLFGVVDAIETLSAQSIDPYIKDELVELYLALAESAAKGVGSREGNLDETQKYIKKAEEILRSEHRIPLETSDYVYETIWVTKIRAASAAVNAIRERLKRGTKTKARITTQLKQMRASVGAKSLVVQVVEK